VGYRPRDRESAIELALELLATGRVRGVPPGHPPAVLERLLGRPFDEGILTFSGNLLRDWGLLEAYYEREHDGAPWRGTLLMGQLHRMPKPVKWKLIARELRAAGYEIVPVPQPLLDDHYFRVVESGSEAIVSGEDVGRWLRRDHIAKISASDWLPLGPRSDRSARQAVHRSVYAVTAGHERTWAPWLAAQEPRPDGAWFWLAHAAVHTVLQEHPERAARATAWHDWLLDQARAACVWSDVEEVLQSTRCAGDALPARTEPIPADDTIRRCLAVLPLTAQAARSLPTAWRELTPSDVRRRTVARALLQAADALRDRATEPDVLAELAAWDDILPTL
jgi:hypothetical protein